jgi:Tol biopolymer transport system component
MRGFLAAAVLGAVAAGTAGAGTPGGGGRIAFTSERAPNLRASQFFTARPLAHAKQALVATAPPAALLSPDARQFAFAQTDATHSELVVRASAGGPPVLVALRRYALEPAAWSPDGTRLAFTEADLSECRPSSTACAIFRLWVVGADGTGLHRISANGIEPAWSPDGRLIAFQGEYSTYEGAGKLWVARADGSHARRLATSFGIDAIAWSPRGREVAFVHNGRVRFVAVSGGSRPGFAGLRIAWSPDARRLAVVRALPRGAGELLVVVGRDGRSAKSVAHAPALAQVAWAPRGEIAYAPASATPARGSAIVVLRPDGHGRRVVVSTDARSRLSLLGWTRSGRLLYRSERGYPDRDVFTMNGDGTDVRRVTNDLATEAGPTWSPDGKQLVFSRTRIGAPPGSSLYAVPVARGPERRLTDAARADDDDPAWAPDGATIAFSRSFRETGVDASEIYYADPAGGGVGQLTRFGGDNRSPTWAPDGARLAFAHRGGMVLGDGIFSIGRDGTGLRLVTEQTSAIFPAWSPDGALIAFVGSGEGATPGQYLFVVPAAGGPATRLAPAAPSQPAWSPDGGRIAYEAPDEDLHSIGRDGSGDGDLTPVLGSDQDPSWSAASG